MCLAIPGKITKVVDDTAIVSYGESETNARLLVKAQVGDYVIVQNKMVVEVVPEESALTVVGGCA